ncbi:hypothetical protein RRG08_008081 [Elysia crispata]|uniref:Uncharacterized protein n=1 Tax=Elysia crispata TaxID=231223 RepID=A0AAE0XZW9_9GAST|nr:hypothetical protein RRG08_008081 [Elysia crispata]
MTGDDILWLTRRDVKDSLPPRVKQTFSSVAVCCPCPLSLISFVKISDLLGVSPGREDRVKELGLPVPLQERLLFKRLQTTFDFSSPSVHLIISSTYQPSMLCYPPPTNPPCHVIFHLPTLHVMLSSTYQPSISCYPPPTNPPSHVILHLPTFHLIISSTYQPFIS